MQNVHEEWHKPEALHSAPQERFADEPKESR